MFNIGRKRRSWLCCEGFASLRPVLRLKRKRGGNVVFFCEFLLFDSQITLKFYYRKQGLLKVKFSFNFNLRL